MSSAGAPLPLGLALGWIADGILGDPVRYHPVAGFGRAAEKLESVMWRPSRTVGTAYVVALVVPFALGVALVDAAVRRHRLARLGLSTVVAWTVLGGRSLSGEARRIADAVARGDLSEARRIAPALVGRDPSQLDGPELCRAAVESVAENTADAVVAPLLWGAIAGPPGAIAYRAANTLDAMVGHHNHRYERFGWAAARLDDLLTWPAARLAAALSVPMAPLVGGNGRRAWESFRRDGNNHPSPNAGQLEAAFAGALGVTLGGTNRYGNRVEDRPLIGAGPRPGVDEVLSAARLSQLIGVAAATVSVLLASRAGK
ncbi:MAG: cobalamin biosynthesis protein [Actinomycetota bacterium]